MIMSQCCYCAHPFWYPYEAGGPGAGGFGEHKCEECGKISMVRLVSIGGETIPWEDFKEQYIDTGLVGPKKKFKEAM